MSKKKYRSTCAIDSTTGCGTRMRHDAHRADVVAAEHPHRRVAVAVRIGVAVAIKKPLDVWQERDELVVVAFLILSGCTAEFVDHFAPGIALGGGMQHLPMPLHLIAFLQRHQLQWPQQNLPEMAHAFRWYSSDIGHVDSPAAAA